MEGSKRQIVKINQKKKVRASESVINVTIEFGKNCYRNAAVRVFLLHRFGLLAGRASRHPPRESLDPQMEDTHTLAYF